MRSKVRPFEDPRITAWSTGSMHSSNWSPLLRLTGSPRRFARSLSIAAQKGPRMAALRAAEPRTRAAFADFTILQDGCDLPPRKFDTAPPGYWGGLRHVSPDGSAVFDAPIVDRLIRFQPFFPSCMVADRLFLLDVGGWDVSVGRVVGTDFATALLLAEHTPFGVVPRPLVRIRKHAGNYSADVQAMNLGDATILEHVLRRRPSLRPHAATIRESAARRRADALHIAFGRHDHAAVRRIYAQLPRPHRAWRTRLKLGVSVLPEPLRRLLGATLLALGSWGAGRKRDSGPRALPGG